MEQQTKQGRQAQGSATPATPPQPQPPQQPPQPQSFFAPAHKRPRKLKIFLWGSWGTGKTTLALQFPAPVVLDLDGGAELYGDRYKFDVLRSANLVEIKNAIAFLVNGGEHNYQTLVIDPITVYWEILQKYWSDVFLRRNRDHKAYRYEFYDLGPKEWTTIKEDFKTLFNKLLELDMHVVVTAREAVKYKPGDFMVVDGVKFEGHKSLPYMFDTVLWMYREGPKYMALCSKDRAESLPVEPFEIEYKKLAKMLKIDQGNKERRK